MSIFKKPRSPFWHFDFQYRGHRFHGSTGESSQRAAEAVERAEKEKAKAQVDSMPSTPSIPVKLDDVAGRYWVEVGQHHAGEGAPNTERQLKRLIEFFGKDRLLTEIAGGDITRLVAWRRTQRVPNSNKPISPFTINDTTEQLKKLFTRAKVWGAQFPHEPRWRDHWLKTPQERVNELRGDQGERLHDAARDDYKPVLALAELTGLRQAECLLRWSEVDWDNERIVKRGKGDRDVFAPITAEVRALLWPLQGHHPEFVFTYAARRTGERHPITLGGLKTEWRRLRERAGVAGFRFHDYRHDFATKLLRQTGNLKLVSKALNHASVTTTARYAHVVDDDLRVALDEKSRTKSRTERHAPLKLLANQDK